MGNKYRKITISVSNDELDAFENICTVDFEGNKDKELKVATKALRIWRRLVTEWDKKK